MKHAASLLALVIAIHFCTGCATIVTGGGEDQAVRFASTPRGATVYVDDNPVGQTPISVRLTRKDDHQIRIEHPGYKPYERTIESGFNEWIIGNVIIGGLIGIGVDLLSGTNPALDTNNVSAKMKKDDTALAGLPPPSAGYNTTGPPAAAAARPAAYMNATYAAPPPTAAYTSPQPAAPVYQPPPPQPQYQPRPAAPVPVAAQPAPAPARQQPAAQPPQQPAAKAYQGW